MNYKVKIKWFMYHQVHHMKREGHSVSSISKETGLNWRTVNKYLNMSEEEYEQLLINLDIREKKLSPYEDFIRNNLSNFPETGASQMHDWLKEHNPQFPDVPQRTVYNFVKYIRQKYNIPYQKALREFMIVDECDYGQQSQADFGQYNMRTTDDCRKKVWFFSMVLSRSRQKFVFFNDKPFTTKTAIIAHEKAFEHFHGIPIEVVYDQDKLFLTDENAGNLILTKEFKSYAGLRKFSLHFCRKADPQSKGKIENVVKYVKQNFLYNREYIDIDILNGQATAWLYRTANAIIHSRTRRVPEKEWIIERDHLSAFVPIQITSPLLAYNVRKDNTINYHSNFYTLPKGTYKGQDTQVLLKEDDGHIEIFDKNNNLLSKHIICLDKGRIIKNTDHTRDKSDKIDVLIEQVASLFPDKEKALEFLNQVRKEKPRYVRDQILLIRKTAGKFPFDIISNSLTWCINNSIFDAVDFGDVCSSFSQKIEKLISSEPSIILIDPASMQKAGITPQTSKIENYEQFFL